MKIDNNNLFKKRLESLGIAKQVDAAMVVKAVQKTIENNLPVGAKSNVEVVSFSRGILRIATSSSAWSAEVQGILDKVQVNPVKRVFFVGLDTASWREF